MKGKWVIMSAKGQSNLWINVGARPTIHRQLHYSLISRSLMIEFIGVSLTLWGWWVFFSIEFTGLVLRRSSMNSILKPHPRSQAFITSLTKFSSFWRWNIVDHTVLNTFVNISNKGSLFIYLLVYLVDYISAHRVLMRFETHTRVTFHLLPILVL